MQARGLNAFTVYFDVNNPRYMGGNLTIRSEIETENIRSRGFWDIRGVKLWRLILQWLECTL